MKAIKVRLLWFIALGVLGAFSPLSSADEGRQAEGSVGRVIVKLRAEAALLRSHRLPSGADATVVREALAARTVALGAQVGVSLRAGRALDASTQVVSAIGLDGASLAERLARLPSVAYAVPDHRRVYAMSPNDPLYRQGPPMNSGTGGPVSGQWYLRPPDSTTPSAIDAETAWSLVRVNPSLVVAVLDTGIRPEHPDLAEAVLPGYDMVGDTALSNDGDPRDADASDPGDWISRAEAENPSGPYFGCSSGPSSWHGTQTASLIAARANNSIGMAGVASGVKILPVRVLGKCGGYDSDIVAGMRWAAGLPVPGVPVNPYPARVINLSLGGDGGCTLPYLDAIAAFSELLRPPVVVAAAGNNNGRAVEAPASCRGVMAVGALRHAGSKVGYSALGPEVAVSAPGGNCVNTQAGEPCLYPVLAATDRGETKPQNPDWTDSFNAGVGTSNAAPLVSGVVALMLSARESLSPDTIRLYLQRTARPFPASGLPDSTVSGPLEVCRSPEANDQLECYCTTSTCGAGMLDARAALLNVVAEQQDCLFEWAQLRHPALFPDGGQSLRSGAYRYRYYPAVDAYLGVSNEDGQLYYLANGTLNDLGPALQWYAQAGCR